VHDFVIQLPEAYQTVIGEDSTGVRLSGGQKQRICMARALMKDCRILLLDEPTNDLDIENEKLLLDIIYQLAKNKLVILITHHLNLVRENESVVYFMENGVIREQGSHSQLMALRGRYFRFVQLASLMQNPEAGDLAQSFHATATRPPGGGGGGGAGLLPPRGGGGGGGGISESDRSEREDDPRRGLLPRAGPRGGK
jgi:ABC-type multidrug transport system ATPase subunit